MLAMSEARNTGLRGLLADLAGRGRLRFQLVDVADTDAVLDACGGADLLRVETPTNTLLALADLEGLCAGARERGVRVIVHATSLGGVESTMERRARHPGEAHLPPGLIRLSVGCEHVDDLWADLAQALEAAA